MLCGWSFVCRLACCVVRASFFCPLCLEDLYLLVAHDDNCVRITLYLRPRGLWSGTLSDDLNELAIDDHPLYSA